MGLHSNTVLKNSCLKVPIDPKSKLPSASYERKLSKDSNNSKISYQSEFKRNGNSSLSLKEFYKSIPDYKDVNHLSDQEFYLKLQRLKENKNMLLLNFKHTTSNDKFSIKENIESDSIINIKSDNYLVKKDNEKIYDKLSTEKYLCYENISESDFGTDNNLKSKVNTSSSLNKYLENSKQKYKYGSKKDSLYLSEKNNCKTPSLSYTSLSNDPNISMKNDYGYKHKFDNKSILTESPIPEFFSKKSYSVPSSPIKRRNTSGRTDDLKILGKLKEYTDDLEYLFLEKYKKPKQFKANPVPIESRIPLYDKIMEDQELRRAISKLQSTAELQAQMKPFSFTEREENYGSTHKLGCSRLCKSNPHLSLTPTNENKSKQFKANPIPKNLFSNYIYEKMREDDFYRALNRRIRAEEMLKSASLPPSMAKREKNDSDYHSLTCKKYHNYMEANSDDMNIMKHKKKSKVKKKSRKKCSINHDNYIKDIEDLKDDCDSSEIRIKNKSKPEDDLVRIYGSNSSDTITPSSGYGTRPRSAVDLNSINKSNLASILRIQSSKKKLEAEVIKQLEEDRYQAEMKWRDSVLRRKPAWKSLKYSNTDDFIMRLQMRKDEERLRREQFLHEMELMYGRVHCQPMLFERTYNPQKIKYLSSENRYYDKLQQSKYKSKSGLNKNFISLNTLSPNRSRKVSINETAETIGDDMDDLLYKNCDVDDSISKSSDEIPENIIEDRKND